MPANSRNNPGSSRSLRIDKAAGRLWPVPTVKPVHFIAPVIALAIAGGILGDQRISVSKLEAGRTALRQRKIQAMEKEEPVAALDQIAAPELDDLRKMMLENMVIGSLVRKDPELALKFACEPGRQRSGCGSRMGRGKREETSRSDHG